MAGHMRRILPWFLLLAGCEPKPPVERIGTAARALRAELGEGGAFFRDLRDGETLEIRGEESFPADDGIALLVLAKIHLDVSLGRARMDDETRRRIEALIARNDPAVRSQLLAQAGGPEAVTVYARSLGLEKSDVKAGTAVPREIGKLLDRLWRGEVVSPAVSAEMIRTLSAPRADSALLRRLPRGTRVAHLGGVALFLDGRPWAAVLWSPNAPAAVRALFDYVNAK